MLAAFALPLLASMLSVLSLSPAAPASGRGQTSAQADTSASGAASKTAQQADPTAPPEGATKALIVYGRGAQAYRCEAGADGAGGWVFVAPQAELFRNAERTGAAEGTHSAGPVWRWNDGSALAGTLIAKKAAPTPTAIPWLLLSTRPTADSVAGGQLQKFTYVRRTETEGGVAPPSACTSPRYGQLVQVPYTATYTFYVGH